MGARNPINTTIDSHSRVTSNSAWSGRLNVKKSMLHNTFNTPLMANRMTVHERAALSGECSHDRPAESAINPNINVQAGPNTQSGGCQSGFFRL